MGPERPAALWHCVSLPSFLKSTPQGEILVGVRGFEPPTHWSQTSCATGLRHTPKIVQSSHPSRIAVSLVGDAVYMESPFMNRYTSAPIALREPRTLAQPLLPYWLSRMLNMEWSVSA